MSKINRESLVIWFRHNQARHASGMEMIYAAKFQAWSDKNVTSWGPLQVHVPAPHFKISIPESKDNIEPWLGSALAISLRYLSATTRERHQETRALPWKYPFPQPSKSPITWLSYFEILSNILGSLSSHKFQVDNYDSPLLSSSLNRPL